MSKVAFVGLGVMGYHMAGHLKSGGHDVTVYNRTATKAAAWVKEHGDNHRSFSWQAGYGAFTLGISQLPTLLRYIDNQEEHHRKRSFRDEFREFLTRYEIEFDERYVWD
jgi:predicted NAD/FAD-dependent oxidoreductase